MTFLKKLGLLVPLLFSASIWAQNIQINPNHPDQYTVVKGDTLWDISAKFLQNPWQWTEIWDKNPQIKNPDLIYPGDTVYFSIVDGMPQLSFNKYGAALNNNGVIKPRIRESDIDSAIKLIPTDAIAQFLTSPKVIGKDGLDDSPYVIDFAGEHLVVGAGDRVYVRAIPNPQSLDYTVYRSGETYINPDTKEVLGYEATYIADARIERSGDPATLAITKSDSEIRRGDRIMRSVKNELALNFFPSSPKKEINGSIISVLDGVSQIGMYNVVVIDKGIVDGLKEGHTLNIYHQGRLVKDQFSKVKNEMVRLPNEIAGVLMVFRSFDRVSYALVLEASQAINLLDRVQTH